MELHQLGERPMRVVRAVEHGRATREQVVTDPHQQLREQRILVGEVPVDGGTADADGRSEILEPYAGESALGDQRGRRLQQLPTAVGLSATAWC